MRNTKKDLARGFTLIEILIVLVVLSVSVGLAVPVYQANIQKQKDDEAKINLYTIYTAEKIYKVNNGKYWGSANPMIAQINQTLKINLAAPKYYTHFKITAGGSGNINSSFNVTVSET